MKNLNYANRVDGMIRTRNLQRVKQANYHYRVYVCVRARVCVKQQKKKKLTL